jgi:magnesium transporter
VATNWVDLLDPDQAALRDAWPGGLDESAVALLLAPHTHEDEPRPRFEGHGAYVFGVLLVPVLLVAEDRVVYQECDVVLAAGKVLTVRKVPPDGDAIDLSDLAALCTEKDLAPGMIAYHVVDQVAEGFLDVVDALNEEIDELEDHVEDWDADRIRARLSALRHDVLHIRRTLAPTRDAIREVVDNRIEFEGDEVFTHDVELNFGNSYDKLLRAADNLEFARDLVGGVRDYHVAKVANDQNEVMKRLAVIATIFLPLAFLTGFWGQNFSYLVIHIEHGKTAFWLLGIGVELVAAAALFGLITWRRWL